MGLQNENVFPLNVSSLPLLTPFGFPSRSLSFFLFLQFQGLQAFKEEEGCSILHPFSLHNHSVLLPHFLFPNLPIFPLSGQSVLPGKPLTPRGSVYSCPFSPTFPGPATNLFKATI